MDLRLSNMEQTGRFGLFAMERMEVAIHKIFKDP